MSVGNDVSQPASLQQGIQILQKKVFWVTISTNRTEYIVTNDLNQSSTDDVEFESQARWKTEEFHARIKQLTGLEFCQCRLGKIQRNRKACAMLVWNHWKKLATHTGKTIYQLKHQLLSNYKRI